MLSISGSAGRGRPGPGPPDSRWAFGFPAPALLRADDAAGGLDPPSAVGAWNNAFSPVFAVDDGVVCALGATILVGGFVAKAGKSDDDAR